MSSAARDSAIDTLLDLNGETMDQGDGYWVKFEAWLIEPTPQIPHGIRYSLTLHDPYGKRILGYDNAHATKRPKNYKYAGQIQTYDHTHQHSSDKGTPYEFKNAQQLINDFFSDVDQILGAAK